MAIKLNVVRQTVSKWENGLSVPDSSMLIILANELDTTVSELLGEPVAEPTTDDLKILSEKLEFVEVLNEKCINDWTVQHGWTWIHKRSTDDL